MNYIILPITLLMSTHQKKFSKLETTQIYAESTPEMLKATYRKALAE